MVVPATATATLLVRGAEVVCVSASSPPPPTPVTLATSSTPASARGKQLAQRMASPVAALGSGSPALAARQKGYRALASQLGGLADQLAAEQEENATLRAQLAASAPLALELGQAQGRADAAEQRVSDLESEAALTRELVATLSDALREREAEAARITAEEQRTRVACAAVDAAVRAYIAEAAACEASEQATRRLFVATQKQLLANAAALGDVATLEGAATPLRWSLFAPSEASPMNDPWVGKSWAHAPTPVRGTPRSTPRTSRSSRHGLTDMPAPSRDSFLGAGNARLSSPVAPSRQRPTQAATNVENPAPVTADEMARLDALDAQLQEELSELSVLSSISIGAAAARREVPQAETPSRTPPPLVPSLAARPAPSPTATGSTEKSVRRGSYARRHSTASASAERARRASVR